MHCIISIKHQENPSSFHLSLEIEKLFLTFANPSSSAQSEPSLYETQSSIYRGNNEDEDKEGWEREKDRKGKPPVKFIPHQKQE